MKQQRRTQNAERRTQTTSVKRRSSFCDLRSALCVRSRAFTLTEILVVLVIVVLILGMAMPVFRAITGSRSEEGAANQVSAMLGRARADALGLQQPVGVLFSLDAEGQNERMALVEFAPCPDWTSSQVFNQFDCVKIAATTPAGATLYYICTQQGTTGAGSKPSATQSDGPAWRWVGGPPLQMRPDTDVEQLPLGVAAQTVCNGAVGLPPGPPNRTTDGYLSTGVIIFDGSGRLATESYGIPDIGPLAKALELRATATQHAGYPSVTGVYRPGSTPPLLGVDSQYGLVLFQREAFVSQGFTVGDPIYTVSNSPPPTPPSNASWKAAYTSGTPSEFQEEAWLDLNATPLLINRYNGTLVKGE